MCLLKFYLKKLNNNLHRLEAYCNVLPSHTATPSIRKCAVDNPNRSQNIFILLINDVLTRHTQQKFLYAPDVALPTSSFWLPYS